MITVKKFERSQKYQFRTPTDSKCRIGATTQQLLSSLTSLRPVERSCVASGTSRDDFLSVVIESVRFDRSIALDTVSRLFLHPSPVIPTCIKKKCPIPPFMSCVRALELSLAVVRYDGVLRICRTKFLLGEKSALEHLFCENDMNIEHDQWWLASLACALDHCLPCVGFTCTDAWPTSLSLKFHADVIDVAHWLSDFLFTPYFRLRPFRRKLLAWMNAATFLFTLPVRFRQRRT